LFEVLPLPPPQLINAILIIEKVIKAALLTFKEIDFM